MSLNYYYVRLRGTVEGPYEEKQIEDMLKAGKLSRYHQISPNEIDWVNLGDSDLIKLKQPPPEPEKLSVPSPPTGQEPPPPAVATAIPVKVAAPIYQQTASSPVAYPHDPYAANTSHQRIRRTSGMAIASLALSLVGIGLLAIIFGHMALSDIEKSEDQVEGKGMAVAGLIIGYIGLAFTILWLISWVIATDNYQPYNY